MNEEQIRQLINLTCEFCKTEHQDALELIEMMEYSHPDWNVSNYMEGYHKGRLRMIEHLRNAI
jgi:hypothetical protein